MSMFSRRKQTARSKNDASQIFRQFAWNIAGSLAQTGTKKTKLAPRRRTKTTAIKRTKSQ